MTVIPLFEKLAASAAPLMKPVPVIVMFWLVAPWPELPGSSRSPSGRR